MEEAIDALFCLAWCLLSPELLGAAYDLDAKYTNGDFRVGPTPQGAGMITLAERISAPGVSPSRAFWTAADHSNVVLISSTDFQHPRPAGDGSLQWGSPDGEAAVGILAAALAHELCHCKSLTNSTTNGVWDNPGSYKENERLCHQLELLILEYLVLCDCLDLTEPDTQNELIKRFKVVDNSMKGF